MLHKIPRLSIDDYFWAFTGLFWDMPSIMSSVDRKDLDR